ncbi:hypothetical protein [Ammoniphilus sp. 3BR4]|uniref:hypothetical protein n=1 Tax=Ammoniphilus sp. 3BR4 TaxID=3158265 RepID=UPI0034653A04
MNPSRGPLTTDSAEGSSTERFSHFANPMQIHPVPDQSKVPDGQWIVATSNRKMYLLV